MLGAILYLSPFSIRRDKEEGHRARGDAAAWVILHLSKRKEVTIEGDEKG
jgi:hypothetical protein